MYSAASKIDFCPPHNLVGLPHCAQSGHFTALYSKFIMHRKAANSVCPPEKVVFGYEVASILGMGHTIAKSYSYTCDT